MFGRRRAREIALQILFQADVGNLPIEEAIEATLLDLSNLDRDVINYAIQLVKGTWSKKDELDRQIQNVATHWTLERMAAVDRNLIRIALYEMLYVPDVPYRVAINEAIELAKDYGTSESRRFVNGVLGALVRKLKLDKDESQK
ncbi:MAG: transcription antitermination factor NusB [Armatimonadetes bacterium]|nr:transcription antitermination factor NusB [Armatimonadota bacterium]MDW8027846.1 transcription antitermination factor NusB [Armatimonadota bacterium]